MSAFMYSVLYCTVLYNMYVFKWITLSYFYYRVASVYTSTSIARYTVFMHIYELYTLSK